MSPPSASRRRYLFRHRLGVGGFGEVYRATVFTGAVEMDVAVKLLRQEYGEDETAALRLRDEARFLSALRHPSIVRVHDLVRLQGRLALVTEYVDGEDLRWALKRTGPLPARAAAEIMARVADALHAASTTAQRGSTTAMELVHRDVKPGNIHLGRHGGVTLLDFGIARTDALSREAATAAYAIVGSGPYTAPETILREPYTAAGDLWGLGTTIYEALSGERLFQDADLRALARLFVKGDPEAQVAASIGGLDIPEALATLLLDVLKVDPEDRPTALEVMRRADDLADSLSGPNLRRWALNREWQQPNEEATPLDGLTLVEQPLDGDPGASMPPASPVPEAAKSAGPTSRLARDPDVVDSVETEETTVGTMVPTATPPRPAAAARPEPRPYDDGPPMDFADSDEEKTVVLSGPAALYEEIPEAVLSEPPHADAPSEESVAPLAFGEAPDSAPNDAPQASARVQPGDPSAGPAPIPHGSSDLPPPPPSPVAPPPQPQKKQSRTGTWVLLLVGAMIGLVIVTGGLVFGSGMIAALSQGTAPNTAPQATAAKATPAPAPVAAPTAVAAPTPAPIDAAAVATDAAAVATDAAAVAEEDGLADAADPSGSGTTDPDTADATEDGTEDGTPDDVTAAAPQPAPETTPEPEPAPAPEAAPVPVPEPTPAPAPAPSPAPAPAPVAPAPAAPAPAPAPSYSTRPPDMDTAAVVFNADVVAEVRVNGVLKGTTPITVRLPEGTHTFEAMVPAHPETKTGGPIDVLPGKTYQLNLKFSTK